MPIAVKIPAGQRARIPVQFLDTSNKPEAVEKPTVTSSDEGVAIGAFDTNGDLLITRVAPGKATLTVSADADVSPVDDVEISNTIDVEVPAVMADHVAFGEPTFEADPAAPAVAPAAQPQQ